ncbi:helix-turn-helix transcriptional regulator [Actinoplanes sp. NPDC049118]|uniref:helix-turn-helix domain-containing protein n=1 Tax=Actinoplanes sp. NPDC049118 TaxID=3155769 RepID=UPI0033EE3462
MTVTTDTAPRALTGWAARDDSPEEFPGVQHVWKRRRLTAGLKQSTVIRRLTELAAREGVSIAAPASLKTMLSKWENGATMSPSYEELLCRIYGIRCTRHTRLRPARYRNNAIYDRLLHAVRAQECPLTQPGLR